MADPRFEELECLYTPERQRLLNASPGKLLLATKVVRLASKNGGYLVHQRDGSWMTVSDGVKACQVLIDQWGGVAQSYRGIEMTLTANDIKPFVLGDAKLGMLPELPIVTGAMMAPTSDAFAIRYRNHLFVNSWRNTIMAGDPNAMRDPEVRRWVTVLLRMIREGLAAQDDALDWEAMLTKLHARDPDEIVFRFIMSWWAIQLQSPGVNLQTNLCHFGSNQGVGKGTLQEVMRWVFGGDLLTTANSDELARGWTDQIPNRLAICINEIGTGSGRAAKDMNWNQFTKATCNEAEITVAARYLGVGGGPTPNFCNWNFTSNDERGMKIDDNDRRTAMFPTTYDTTKNALAQQMQELLKSGNVALIQQVMQAFAHILRGLNVEVELIAKPVENALREENKSANVDVYLWWLMDDERYERDIEHKPGYYAQKFNETLPNQENAVSALMMSSVLQGFVRRGEILGRNEATGKRAPNGRARKRWWFTIPSENFPTEGSKDREAKKARMSELRALPSPELRH